MNEGGALASPRKGLRLVIPEGRYEISTVHGGVVLSSKDHGYFLADGDFKAYVEDGQISIEGPFAIGGH